MRFAMVFGGFVALLIASQVAEAADSRFGVAIMELTKERNAAIQENASALRDGPSKVKQREANDRCSKTLAALARRALVIAKQNIDGPDGLEALIWILNVGPYDVGAAEEGDAAYQYLAEQYLDRDELLPICRFAWLNSCTSVRAGAFLRAALERSPNSKVRALSCFSLGKYQHELAKAVRDLNDPIRSKILEEWFLNARISPRNVERIRRLDGAKIKRDAESLYDRTVKEFSDVRPMGLDTPPLGELAKGMLFRLNNLEIGCAPSDLVGEDLDGKPLTLSEFRGKVVVITFWATWCGPCMRQVPAEKSLVDRMKGRPFIMVGVNGDENRKMAQTVAAKEGVNWRSFSDGGPHGPISMKLGVIAWPTTYVIDARGKIRDDGLVYSYYENKNALERAVESIVAEAEAGRP
jgi:thiol-disulfide isomerase/thioredoxin